MKVSSFRKFINTIISGTLATTFSQLPIIFFPITIEFLFKSTYRAKRKKGNAQRVTRGNLNLITLDAAVCGRDTQSLAQSSIFPAEKRCFGETLINTINLARRGKRQEKPAQANKAAREIDMLNKTG